MVGLVDSTTSAVVAEVVEEACAWSFQEDAHCTDESALATRLCVQLLEREATSPSSQGPVKTKNKTKRDSTRASSLCSSVATNDGDPSTSRARSCVIPEPGQRYREH